MGNMDRDQVMASLCFILVICMCIFGGLALTNGSYNSMVEDIDTLDVHYWEQQTCQYHDCTNTADAHIRLSVYSALKRVLSFDNNADLSVSTESFTYTPTEKRIGRDSATYLVPQGDGSYKVEKRSYLYEYETKGKSGTYTYVQFDGFYCGEHADTAKETLKQDLKAVMVTRNPSFWIFVVILPVIIAAAGVWFLFIPAKKK